MWSPVAASGNQVERLLALLEAAVVTIQLLAGFGDEDFVVADI